MRSDLLCTLVSCCRRMYYRTQLEVVILLYLRSAQNVLGSLQKTSQALSLSRRCTEYKVWDGEVMIQNLLNSSIAAMFWITPVKYL